jgi:hypothetical protein
MLSFGAELTISLRATGNCSFPVFACSASALLEEGVGNQASGSVQTPFVCSPVCCTQSASLDTKLRVNIVRSAGETFVLHFHLASGGNHVATATGQLQFTGLPSGVSVVSCQGYRQDFVTASTVESWGRLKLRYR